MVYSKTDMTTTKRFCFPVLVGVAIALAGGASVVWAADTNTTANVAAPVCDDCSDTGLLLDTNVLVFARAKVDHLTTCPVSGDKLGEMGEAYAFVYKGQQVKLCCDGCKKDFLKDPDKYLALIRAADKPAKN